MIGTYVDPKRTRAYFVSIKEKINSKLTRWNARFLYQAGKIILVKSNLSIPLFTMQGIKIPNYIAKEIDSSKRDLTRTILNLIIVVVQSH